MSGTWPLVAAVAVLVDMSSVAVAAAAAVGYIGWGSFVVVCSFGIGFADDFARGDYSDYVAGPLSKHSAGATS